MTFPSHHTARKRADAFAEAAIGDELVVMEMDGGTFFSLQGTARAIWELIDGSRDRPAILAALMERFDAPAGTIENELDAFLKSLAAASLIESA